MQTNLTELEYLFLEQQAIIMDLESRMPRHVRKITKSSGGKTWPSFVVEMSFEDG